MVREVGDGPHLDRFQAGQGGAGGAVAVESPAAQAAAAAARTRHALSLGLVSTAHAVEHAVAAVRPMIFPYAMAAMHFDYAALGALLGVTNLVGGVLQGVHGWSSQFIRRKALIGLGNIGIGISMALMALSKTFTQFGAAMLLGRVAGSPQHPMANSLMSDWYPQERRGTAFSIHFAGGNVGAIITPIVAGILIARYGWQSILYVLAIVGLVVGLLNCLFVEDARKPVRVARREAHATAARSYWSSLRDPNVRRIILSQVVAAGGRGLGIVMVFVPLYLSQGLQLNIVSTGTLFTVMMLGSVVGPLVSGRLGDHFGRKPVVLASLAGATLSTLLLILVGPSLFGVYASLILMGLTVYNESPLMQALLADNVTKEDRDAAFSLFFLLTHGAGAIWSAVLGMIVNNFGFTAAFLTMMASYVASGLIILGIRGGTRSARAAAA